MGPNKGPWQFKCICNKNAIRQGIKYLNQEVNKSISEEIKKIDISEI